MQAGEERVGTRKRPPRLLVEMPHDLHQELHQQAEREDRPVSRIVREAIRRYLAQPRDPLAGET